MLVLWNMFVTFLMVNNNNSLNGQELSQEETILSTTTENVMSSTFSFNQNSVVSSEVFDSTTADNRETSTTFDANQISTVTAETTSTAQTQISTDEHPEITAFTSTETIDITTIFSPTTEVTSATTILDFTDTTMAPTIKINLPTYSPIGTTTMKAKLCRENEVYSCLPFCPRTCNSPISQIICRPIPSHFLLCRRGCTCRSGYLIEKTVGKCVKECPQKEAL